MDLIKSFRSNSLKGNNSYTHTSMFPVKSAYYIACDKLDNVMDMYCEKVVNTKISLSEKIDGACPLLTDIDLKRVFEDDIYPLYNRQNVVDVVKMYHSCFNELFKNNPLSEQEYICVLLEKPAYIDDCGKYFKNGFHLHFPYLFLSVNDIKNHIYPLIEEKINSYFHEKVFDSGIINTQWLLYGSSKSESKDPYLISTIFNKNLQEISLTDAFKDYVYLTFKQEQISLKTEQEIKHNLPKILSVFPHGRKVKQIPLRHIDSLRVQKIISDLQEYEIMEFKQPKTPQYYSQKLAEVTKLLALLSDKRSEDHNDWMRIGWSIFNICGPSLESLQCWIDFSKRCEYKFNTTHNEQRCINEWKRMRFGNITLGTLHHFASEDNPKKYSQYRYEASKEKVHAGLSGTHYDIACILYEDYKNTFKCTSMKGEWYVFNGHIWKHTDEGVLLSKKISTEMVARFEKMSNELNTERMECEDDFNKDLINNRMKQCEKVIKLLKSHAFKVSVMKEACELFYDSFFLSKLDTNPDLIAFANGVYDLKRHLFRPGQYDDYLSKCMTIDYKEFDEFDPSLLYVQQYLETMFPDKSLKEYFLDLSCTIFKGGNQDKIVSIWYGSSGDNGKSKLEEIFQKMLGIYAQSPPVSTICAKNRASSSSCTPELARAGNGVRALFFQEPSKEDGGIHVGILKELSGNDVLYTRDLFQKGKDVKEIKPMFKMFLICNEIPAIYNADKAVWNRLRVIPFESTFVHANQLPETYEEQLLEKKFLMDPYFEEKIPEMLEPFAYLLLERYKKTLGKIRTSPEKVLAATLKYKSKNDTIQQFVDEYIEKCEAGMLMTNEIYELYTNWHTEAGLSKSMKLTKLDFKEKLSILLNTDCSVLGWHGFKRKQQDEFLVV